MNKAFILAGGLGMRLRPYTTILPKPLLPIGDKAIIEHILHGLDKASVHHVTVSLGYKHRIVRSYVEAIKPAQMEIHFTVEETPLGTAGALKLMENVRPDDKILVVNGDTYTDFDFNLVLSELDSTDCAFVLAHRRNEVDFGVVKIDKSGFLLDYIEKPKFELLVSTGIYAFRGRVLDLMSETRTDMPDLIRAQAEKNRVKCLIHEGLWMDLGREEDLIKANQLEVNSE